jgi:hypothetical protein
VTKGEKMKIWIADLCGNKPIRELEVLKETKKCYKLEGYGHHGIQYVKKDYVDKKTVWQNNKFLQNYAYATSEETLKKNVKEMCSEEIAEATRKTQFWKDQMKKFID